MIKFSLFYCSFCRYILSYFTIFFLIARPKLGFILVLVQFCAVAVFSLLYMHLHQIPIYYSLIHSYLYDPKPFEDAYLHSFLHNPAYLLGIVCAFLIKREVRFEILRFRMVRLIIYLATLAVPYLTMSYIYDLEQTGTEPSRLVRILLPIFSRLVSFLLPFFFVYSNLSGYSSKVAD